VGRTWKRRRGRSAHFIVKLLEIPSGARMSEAWKDPEYHLDLEVVHEIT
jgi:hypothetical protein